MRWWLLLFLFLLSSCATKPGVNLASKASMIHKGVSTKEEVLRYLGNPQRIERLPDGKEVWVYFQLQKDALASLPALGDKVGRKEIEVLRVIFYGNQVVDCIYYVAKPRS